MAKKTMSLTARKAQNDTNLQFAMNAAVLAILVAVMVVVLTSVHYLSVL